jgi:hypothetical protein
VPRYFVRCVTTSYGDGGEGGTRARRNEQDATIGNTATEQDDDTAPAQTSK